MDAAIIELDPLPDPIRPATQNNDFFPVCRACFTLLAVRGIQIGSEGFEFGGAGIDP